jgi:hypothetical protein
MPLHPDFRDMLSALIAEDAEFLLVGAMAVAAHGYPRATGDMDILVNPVPGNAARVWRALVRFGAPLAGLAPEDLENPRLILQLGVPPWRIDVLTSIKGVEFAEAWLDRELREVDGLALPVLSRPHLIRNKRAVARPQDLADVARLEGAHRPPSP